MVFIFDDESEFDASVDELWAYLPSENHKHPSSKVISREVSGNTVTITSERPFNGQIVRFKSRNTLFPPVGMVQEYLEGPIAGSKAFTFYTPKGDKTRITLVGEFRVEGMTDEESTKKAVFQMLENSFNEDTVTLKKMK